jgi:hypothetical protein
MDLFEIMISAGSVAIALCGLWYVRKIIRTSGRDRPHDPERVRRLVERTKRWRS